jgi:hypothetical protein
LRRGIFIGLIFILPALAFSNHGAAEKFSVKANVKAFLTAGNYKAESIKSFESFLQKLDKKNSSVKSERALIRNIFEKTHHRFLKNYQAYASLNETFDNGSYNCLTGTILFSLFLHHYNIEHQVIETNYHIFILAETNEGQILLEATDPLNGFVTSAREIEARISIYKQNQLQEPQRDKAYYKFRFELFNAVSLDELQGLTYYNNAVNSFNRKNLELAVQNLVKANELYFSYRIEEFSQILLLSLQQSDLDLKTKENCMNTILSLRQKSLPLIIASN